MTPAERELNKLAKETVDEYLAPDCPFGQFERSEISDIFKLGYTACLTRLQKMGEDEERAIEDYLTTNHPCTSFLEAEERGIRFGIAIMKAKHEKALKAIHAELNMWPERYDESVQHLQNRNASLIDQVRLLENGMHEVHSMDRASFGHRTVATRVLDALVAMRELNKSDPSDSPAQASDLPQSQG